MATCTVPHLDPGGAVVVDVIMPRAGGRGQPPALPPRRPWLRLSSTRTPATTPTRQPLRHRSRPAAVTQTRRPRSLEVHESPATGSVGGKVTETVTVVNDGPTAATGVEITDVLDAATELLDVAPGAAIVRFDRPARMLTREPSRAVEPDDRAVAAAARPRSAAGHRHRQRRSGRIPTSATTPPMPAARIQARNTTGRLRIVPVRPVANAGKVVGFVVMAAVAKPVPGVAAQVCVTLPPGLQLVSAPQRDRRAGAGVLARRGPRRRPSAELPDVSPGRSVAGLAGDAGGARSAHRLEFLRRGGEGGGSGHTACRGVPIECRAERPGPDRLLRGRAAGAALPIGERRLPALHGQQ